MHALAIFLARIAPALAIFPARIAAALALVCASCDGCGAAGATQSAGADARAAASNDALGPGASPPDAAPGARRGPAAVDGAGTGAGPSSCRLAYGPAEQPFRGPAALVVSAAELKLVANDNGKPRVYTVPLGPPPAASAASVMPKAPGFFVGMRWPPCAVAGRWAYCQAAGGIVNRTTLGGADTKVVAKSRPSTRIAAAALGADHAVVATLDVRRTVDGDRLQAFVTLDDGATTGLSEEGAGATVLHLALRGDHAVALYLDARTSMVPVHARSLSMRGPELALGEDAVVFVAGPPERAVDFAVAGGPRSLFALLPIGKDSREFGMAAIPISEPPKDDVPPVWSMYPNGLDPAPVAGTAQLEEGAWVARVRPADPSPGSPRILELGRLEPTGEFRSFGALATGLAMTDVAIARDGFGAVWIVYGDSKATWLERRICP